ncbi:phosphoglucomutase/phosphomannomutase PgmG [Kordiimonas laminariae]|uniref:phosphoglucomutase/phosphomannomutase PgmG n=1 Tax=Kordiimonas laminariae TaxID=2917717 RepID=UPI001FF3A606|nr:phosphomannomutase/phosphoglucomutase [Kordiimonas laminariae]MCK0069547.1 phosphomannomutase/phosphoglucomutase [Kordiimonas laminariae]
MTAHTFHSTVLREYDIRGIVGETISTADANALGKAYGTQVKREGGKTVCVGFDGRISSPDLSNALIEGIASTGVNVLNVGLGGTPMLYYSVFELDTDGGIMVTGSHNPPNYNGFKIMKGKKPCFGEAIQSLGQTAAAGDFETGSGSIEEVDIFDRYIDRLMRDVDMQDFKIAWDPANGSAGPAVEALVKRLPGEHIVINAEVDGTFPNHHADPTVEKNLQQLKDVVAAEGCDMGLSFDGDGDRIGAVDSQGRVVWGDQMLAVMAGDLLKEIPGAPIIADVKASQALFDRIAELGGEPVMWKTGHSLIKSKMVELEAPLAGEMSGHIFYKHKFYGHDDAIYAGIRFLNAVSKQGGDLDALKDGLPAAINTPELRFDCDETRKFEVVKEVKARLEEAGANMSTVDGVRVQTEDGWWLLRASNTQAVLVARCEALSEEGLERLKVALVAALKASGVAAPADL